jgi:hypothetical protein
MNPTSSHGQNNNGQATFFSQKAEKLATAVYMITDIIDSREPLRWKIREEAMEVLSLTSTQTGDASLRSSVLYRLTQTLERIQYILAVAQNTKLISTMNVSIVMKEYADLKEKISASWSDAGAESSLRLDHKFFKVESLPAPAPIQKSFPQPEVKRTVGTSAQSIGQTQVSVPKVVAPVVSVAQPVEEKKSDRRSAIIELLQTKSEISVSDAMKLFQGVSDKTVQRELVAMVEVGILQKKGEKRWSTYSLKN